MQQDILSEKPNVFKSKKYFLALILYSLYCFLCYQYKEDILHLFENNLPFREAYIPSLLGVLLVYVAPIIFGYITGINTKISLVRSPAYFLNSALLFGLFVSIPYILFYFSPSSGWLAVTTTAYYVMLVPILFLFGTLPHVYKSIRVPKIKDEIIPGIRLSDLLIALFFGGSAFVLNYQAYIKADYLVGADVYYHTAMTAEIISGNGITSNPYFFEGTNYYYSLTYYFLASIAEYFTINLQDVWMLYPAICAFFFYFFFYLFVRRFVASQNLSLLATVLAFTSQQLIWTDPSLRNVSYLYFIVFFYYLHIYLSTKKFYYLLLSVVFFILVLTSHPEIAIHTIGIIVAYLVFKYSFLTKVITSLLEVATYSKKTARLYFANIDNIYTFGWLLFIYMLTIGSLILLVIANHSVEHVLIFNEIPLSIFRPLGPISFIVFLLAPLGILYQLKSAPQKKLLLLAIASLFASVIFYFGLIWVVYHRYIPETAYFALAIFAVVALKHSLLNIKIRHTTLSLIWSSVLLSVFFSLYPRYSFLEKYTLNTNNTLSGFESSFTQITEFTKPGDVILVNPENIMNRYLPVYTDRYIFAGAIGISREKQWHVLSTCAGPFLLDCRERYLASSDFFNTLSLKSLENLKAQYRVDYLLIMKNSAEENSLKSTELGNILSLISEDENYYLFDVKAI